MTKFLAYYTLCPVNDIESFLGVAKSPTENAIICTYDKNVVWHVKLSNQKQLNSWTVQDRFSTRVVFDFKSQQFVGLFKKKSIRCWDEGQSNVQKIKRIKMVKTVAELVTVESSSTLLLYDDGTSESLECALLSRLKPAVVEEQNIDSIGELEVLQAKVFTLLQGGLLLTYFTRKAGEIHLCFNQIDRTNFRLMGEIRRIHVSREAQDARLVGFTVVDGAKRPSLVTIWSDSRLFIQPLTGEADSVGSFITTLDMINAEQPLSVVGIKQNSIAIYAANNSQEGASLLLFNTQFKVVQSRQIFKIFFQTSRLWIIDNNIYLAAGQNVSVVPFRVTFDKIADLVGSQRWQCGFDEVVDLQTLNQDESEEEEISAAMQELTVDRLNVLTERYKLKNFKELDELKMFNEITLPETNDLVIARKAFQPEGSASIRTFSEPNHDLLLFSEPSELLCNKLERCGASEVEITDHLIPLAIEADSTRELVKMLRRFSVISEKRLVEALKFALKCSRDKPEAEESSPNIADLQKNDKRGSLALPLNIFNNFYADRWTDDPLNVVLSCAFNVASMTYHLRREMDLPTAVQLLEYLLQLYESDKVLLEPRWTNETRVESDERIVAWATVLIDSQYQQILLSRDERVLQVLEKWRDIVKGQCEALNELKEVRSQIESLRQNRPLEGGKRFNRWYSIEKVELW